MSSAAMLAVVPAGGSPADGSCPAAIVVIPGDVKGDRRVGSPGVNVSVGWGEASGRIRQGGKQLDRPQQERTKVAPKSAQPREADCGMSGVPNSLDICEGQRRRSRSWARAAGELPGVVEGGMPETERAVKARNHSSVAEALPHSEGSAYKPQSGEIALCRQVGRMGPSKR